jgi:murein hydrolase activator
LTLPRPPKSRRRHATRLAAAAAVALSCVPAGAEDAAPAEDLRSKLDANRTELQTKEERAANLKADVAKLAVEREKLNTRLLETSALIQKSEAQMSAIEGRMGELEAQEKLVRGSLSQQHGHIAKLLAALQRMGRNPPPVLITKREDALGMVRSAMLLAAAFPEMRTQAVELSGKLNELVRVMTDIRTEGDRLKIETASLTEMRTRLAGLMETKKQSLGERQAELAQVRQATQEIQQNVSDLNDLIAKLDETVKRNTALGEYDRETKDAAASASAPAGSAVSALVPAAPDAATVTLPAPAGKPVETALNIPPSAKPSDPQVLEMAPAGTSLVPGNAGRIKPAMAFEVAKARLPLPAQGRKVLSFGEKTQFGGMSKGIVLETRSAALVTSPCDGWIVYAGEFRSYGQLLIINAGGGYHVLVAGLSQIDVQPGQFVLAAEAIGTMSGQPKAAQGASQSSSPVLYVEFRKDGQPIDPDPWWVAGQQKVQG